MRNKLGDTARVQHILDAIVELEKYTKSQTINSFSANSMMIYACIKQLEIIGKASNHLSPNLKEEFSPVE